ncbi:MAG: hypothetical protein U0694_03700 [Anaerolineae bacterium]
MLGSYRLGIWLTALMLWGTGSLAALLAVLHGQQTHGEILAFASDREGQRDIYLMDVAHGITLNLTQDRMFDDAPAWSADGRLAFESYRSRGAAIMVMNTVTYDIEQVTNSAGNYSPAWSPDGQLAYVTTRSANLDVMLLDFSSGEHSDISGNPGDDMNPAWSPDGRIAFDSFNEDQIIGQIFIRNPGTGAGRGVQDSQHYYDPTWSYDGRLAVVSSLAGNADIYLMDPVTGEATPYVHSLADETQPAWSASGLLAYVVGYRDGFGEIYVFNSATGETRNLTRNDLNDFSPAWMP